MLGSLSAFGPFVTDMYVPSLPSMEGYFSTSTSMVQLGLTSSMLGLALGQLFFGPLSDKYGRRKPLLASMLLFAVASIAIIFSPTIEIFIILRFVQGLGGSGGIVISRSVATDSFQGKELLKMLAIIGAINGIAPIAAPVIGGALVDAVGWRGIFTVLLGVGLIILACCCFFRESLAEENRKTESLAKTFGLFGKVCRNGEFMCYVLQQATAQAILFGNIASSPFIVQEHYGYSALVYSVAFAVNGLYVGIGAGASAKFRPVTSVKISCAGMLSLSVLIAAILIFDWGFWAYEIVLNLLLFFMGLTFTASTTMALEKERAEAGTASAVLGALCFISGGLVSPLVGLGNIMVSTGVVFIAGALLSTTSAILAQHFAKTHQQTETA